MQSFLIFMHLLLSSFLGSCVHFGGHQGIIILQRARKESRIAALFQVSEENNITGKSCSFSFANTCYNKEIEMEDVRMSAPVKKMIDFQFI